MINSTWYTGFDLNCLRDFLTCTVRSITVAVNQLTHHCVLACWNKNQMKVTLSSVLVLTALHIVLLVSNSLSQFCGNGDLRLRGPESTRLQGRMEVCYNDTWGTVCQTDFAFLFVTRPVAMVACRQLGLSDQGAWDWM